MSSAEIEWLCRIICKADGVDPDRENIGSGGVIPRDQPYKMWEARRRQAEAIHAAMPYEMYQRILQQEVSQKLMDKARECDAEAKALGMPKGSTQHMCANVWRAAAALTLPPRKWGDK